MDGIRSQLVEFGPPIPVDVLHLESRQSMGRRRLRLAEKESLTGDYLGTLRPSSNLEDGWYVIRFEDGAEWTVEIRNLKPHGSFVTVRSKQTPPTGTT